MIQYDLEGNLVEEELERSQLPQHITLKKERIPYYREAIYPDIRCKTCAYLIRKDYHDKIYYKCELLGCSNSMATDIRLKNVCDAWQKDSP